MATPFNEASFLQVADPELLAMVADDMHRENEARKFFAKQRYDRIAAAAARIETACIDGINEDDYWLEIDPVSYHYWVNREGRDCWSDPQFRREYARDNPSAVRRNVTGKTIITAGWEGRDAA